MDTSEGSTKKHALEEHSKEELVNKYKALLALAQKAKQAKDVLIKENADLKKSLDDPQRSECKAQVRVLMDEKEKLASDLAALEAQVEELKRIGLLQQEQLLALEKLKPPEDNGTNEKLKEKLKLYHSKVIKFAQDVKQLKQARQDLLATFNSYIAQVSQWKTQLAALLRCIEREEEETRRVKTQSDALNCENAKLRGHLEALALNFDVPEELLREPHVFIDERVKQLQASNSRLEREVAECREDAREVGVALVSLVGGGQPDGSDLMGLVRALEARMKEHDEDATSAMEALKLKMADSAEEEMKKARGENVELLAEIKEMNEALKERGETISKQQTFCDKLIDTLNQKEELIKALQREARDKSETVVSEEVLREKDEAIRGLRDELEELRGKLLNVGDEGFAAENMSVSTVSRSDDLARMKDLESSWEERYGKLRNLALKLKRKTAELTSDVSREQAEKAELQQKLNKTVASLQQQMDRLQDELETSRNEGRASSKQIESANADSARSRRLLASSEQLVSKLRGELEVFSREKAEMENWKKQVSGKVQSLKNELKANAVLKKDSEGKTAKLSSELDAKEKTLKHEAEKHAQTKASLQESAEECKRLSLLILELRDYENVAKDVAHDLDKKQEIITGLRNQVDAHKAANVELQAEKKRLEDDVRSLEAGFACVKGENDLRSGKISELEKLLLERELRLQSLSHALEDSKLENEDLTRQLSDAMVRHEKLAGSMRAKEERSRSANLGLEQKLRALQESLKLKEDELIEARGRYENYKIRAKSLMQQGRDFGAEEKLAGEVLGLRGQMEALKEELEESRCAVASQREQGGVLQAKNCELLKQNEALRKEVDDNKMECERMLVERRLNVAEHAEAVRGLKVHAEKLTDYYQQQLSDLEARHSSEISKLQSNAALSPLKTAPAVAPPSMLVREEGEGSENVDGVNLNSLSLEKLLSSSGEPADKDGAASIKKQLSENETKVAHLTALLSDAEQDLAKHVQMNKLLKEEIRRQQRCVEREKHAENMEYLKNVVFKFLTSANVDERTRLVPVLNTILKLSPEEHRKLLMVSKGADGRSWASYLPGGWGA